MSLKIDKSFTENLVKITEIVNSEWKKGTNTYTISNKLNDLGFLTKTGRAWTQDGLAKFARGFMKLPLRYKKENRDYKEPEQKRNILDEHRGNNPKKKSKNIRRPNTRELKKVEAGLKKIDLSESKPEQLSFMNYPVIRKKTSRKASITQLIDLIEIGKMLASQQKLFLDATRDALKTALLEPSFTESIKDILKELVSKPDIDVVEISPLLNFCNVLEEVFQEKTLSKVIITKNTEINEYLKEIENTGKDSTKTLREQYVSMVKKTAYKILELKHPEIGVDVKDKEYSDYLRMLFKRVMYASKKWRFYDSKKQVNLSYNFEQMAEDINQHGNVKKIIWLDVVESRGYMLQLINKTTVFFQKLIIEELQRGEN